LTKQNKVKN